MSRINHRGWIVIDSFASPDGTLCVDLFRHTDGGFGYEHLRRDPEDGRWTVVGGYGGSRFVTASAALAAAVSSIRWLSADLEADFGVEVVVFDLDGVVRHFDPAVAASIEDRHDLERGSVHRVAFGSELIMAVTTGRISKAEWARAIGDSLECPEAAREFITTIGTIDLEMVELVAALRSHGLVTAILTNGTDEVPAELASHGVPFEEDVAG